MPGPAEPTSNDIAADRAVLNDLMAFADAGIYAKEADLASFAISPWVASQLGAFAEHYALDQQHPAAWAKIAVLAARLSGDGARLLANMLTAGNVCFKLQWYEEAEEFYQLVLSSASSVNTHERTAAELGMANLAYRRDDFVDAAYYYDKVLRSKFPIEAAGFAGIVETAAKSYTWSSDVGGALYCILTKNPSTTAPAEKVARQAVDLEAKLRIASRLYLLGADAKGDAMLKAWNMGETRNG